jgi:asparagine synthase (glutamine-hydrolysing)
MRGLIPDKIIDRKKQGFAVPIDDWIGDKLGSTAEMTLKDFCTATDFLDPKGVKRVFESGDARKIWYLFNFALWWNEFIRD